jgi:hypothetical protein
MPTPATTSSGSAAGINAPATNSAGTGPASFTAPGGIVCTSDGAGVTSPGDARRQCESRQGEIVGDGIALWRADSTAARVPRYTPAR